MGKIPDKQYPNLCIRLRGILVRLEESVPGVASDVMVAKPGGMWSAQERAGHLLDLEPLWMARVEDSFAGRQTLTVANLINRKTDEAHHNSRDLKRILAELREARLRLAENAKKLQLSFYAFIVVSAPEAAHAARGSFAICRRSRRAPHGQD